VFGLGLFRGYRLRANGQKAKAKSQKPMAGFFAPTYICRVFPLSGTSLSNFIFASDNAADFTKIVWHSRPRLCS
jgi:hypothetical protein